ncbi:MAG TPA: DEAD/DEAH box helicase [Rhodopila sp.]|nr:DEAD/DEAH box helicase [Rhodopila sp.]
MPTPYSSQDLGRIFDARVLTRGRTLGLTGGVTVELDGDTVTGVVQDRAVPYTVRITPSLLGRRVVFDHRCSCRSTGCAHLAAAAFAALDRFPALRKPEQQTFLDTLTTAAPEKERQRVVFELAPAEPPHACVVATLLIGERTGIAAPTTPRAIARDDGVSEKVRDLAYLLGEGNDPRTGVAAGLVVDVLDALIETGQARWHAGGRRLIKGETRFFASASAATLPPRSGVIVADSGPWYVDATTGAVARVRIQPPAPPRPAFVAPAAPAPVARRRVEPASSEQVIVDRPMVPVLRLTRFPCPDEFGRMRQLDALLLEFDYDGGIVPFDDDRQFVRVNTPGGPVFARRDRAAETAAQEAIRLDGLVQMRMATGKAEKGRLVFVFRGPDAPEAWQGFVAERLPALQALGWRNQIDSDFGPRLVQSVGSCDLKVADTPQGSFSLDFGIEIDGVRHKLLPILMRLHERGGMEAARVIDGEVVTSLDDGRVLKLPADRIARLLAVIEDMIEASSRTSGDTMLLDAAAAHTVLDLEDVLTTRWQEGAAAQVARFRAVSEIPEVAVPASFTASLRPYQQHGVNWLQHLRENNLGGLLADDMGLGKTAQTIAHIVIEQDSGRLEQPALVVVPTTLVPNWSAELARFAPHLRVVVLHGLDRHERRRDLTGVHVVITTYTVLSRDIEEMVALPWHMVVLDEAQAIKSSTSKATHAVCRLRTTHRLCLSGTPIENNLGELWSQFAFLMPGLLGQRKSFNRRFRSPIEKDGDPVRRRQLSMRIRPFILRRTKAAVATELPPKHTILRRITLAPDQRELYETIRAMMHEKVTEGIAERGVAQSHILVLDALLKLRQVCCDPRLVKLPSARLAGSSSKLDDLMEMVAEMVAEGRRILLFSQFTSMLDLMKPVLVAAGIPFVELRGDTGDRAAPVQRFEAGEVPLFLISLKAGGRGLNLTSADTVIHYDPWWNPAVEDQASDRAHRIGQTKSVFVYKLIAADTVEERIVELQERKAALASLALSEDGMALPAMDADDIDYLFGVTPDLLAA